jgi:hypothetical protein
MKKYLYSVVGAALVLGMSACSFDEPEINDPALPTASETAAPEEEPSESPEAEEGVGEFGQVVSWEGVDLTVSKPEKYEPSQSAAGAETYPDSVVFEIKLTNTGSQPFDPSMIYMTASSGGEEASEIFDTEKRVDGAPMTSIRGGKSTTWKAAFNVADPSDILLEVTPDFSMEPVMFATAG